jgi:hypothetical protein
MEDDGAGLRGENRKSNQGGRPAGFGSKTHKAGERFWGRKQRKRWLSREKTMANRRGCVVG